MNEECPTPTGYYTIPSTFLDELDELLASTWESPQPAQKPRQHPGEPPSSEPSTSDSLPTLSPPSLPTIDVSSIRASMESLSVSSPDLEAPLPPSVTPPAQEHHALMAVLQPSDASSFELFSFEGNNHSFLSPLSYDTDSDSHISIPSEIVISYAPVVPHQTQLSSRNKVKLAHLDLPHSGTHGSPISSAK